MARKKNRKKPKNSLLKEQKKLEWFSEDSDENFAFIAGYTSGGDRMELPGKKWKMHQI